MSNRITPKQAQTVVKNLEKKIDALAEGRTSLKASEVSADPVLSKLVQSVSTGCGAAPTVSVAKMKEALKTIGASIASADKNHDGEIGYVEASRLSPLALRMLDMAAGEKTDLPERPKPAPTTPAPSRPVATGCGASTPTPPPVRTGC